MDILKRKELEFYIEQGLVEKVYINDDDRKDLNEKYHENFDEFDDGMVIRLLQMGIYRGIRR